MSIRQRLTWWYAAIMFVSLLLMGVLTFQEFAPGTTRLSAGGADADEGDLSEVMRIIFFCGVPSAGLALAGGWWLMRRALAPIAQLTRAAERIHDRNLHEKLSRSGNGDELDRLTEVFNAMTARLHDAFRHIREFTLHASHELKTPLTILHGEIETALLDPGLSDAHRELFSSQLDELQRLTKIVDGLTLLTKADAGQISLRQEPVRLDEIVREAFEDTKILALPARISVSLVNCQPASLPGDRHRIRQLLLNLCDNAVKYNHPGGAIEFSLRRAGLEAELKIVNTGPAIPPEIMPRLFDRFFRGDPAHNSAIDGCGLGLSIVHWIATAHRGSVSMESVPGEKNIVTVRLPINPEAGVDEETV